MLIWISFTFKIIIMLGSCLTAPLVKQHLKHLGNFEWCLNFLKFQYSISFLFCFDKSYCRFDWSLYSGKRVWHGFPKVVLLQNIGGGVSYLNILHLQNSLHLGNRQIRNCNLCTYIYFSTGICVVGNYSDMQTVFLCSNVAWPQTTSVF